MKERQKNSEPPCVSVDQKACPLLLVTLPEITSIPPHPAPLFKFTCPHLFFLCDPFLKCVVFFSLSIHIVSKV